MSPACRIQPKVRYRVTVTELVDDTATVVMDATGAGFRAAVGVLEHAVYARSTASDCRQVIEQTRPASRSRLGRPGGTTLGNDRS